MREDAVTDIPCAWCQQPFTPMTRGGNRKRFCRTQCKSAFESSARRYAYRAMDLGLLSVAEMKRVAGPEGPRKGDSASRATAGAPVSDFEGVE